jgi:hypothetical protein
MNRILFFLLLALAISGCSYKAYMGMHGRSIKLHPDIHDNVIEDKQCLECHHPDISEGPATPHSDFTGCIKCHNDEIDKR